MIVELRFFPVDPFPKSIWIGSCGLHVFIPLTHNALELNIGLRNMKLQLNPVLMNSFLPFMVGSSINETWHNKPNSSSSSRYTFEKGLINGLAFTLLTDPWKDKIQRSVWTCNHEREKCIPCKDIISAFLNLSSKSIAAAHISPLSCIISIHFTPFTPRLSSRAVSSICQINIRVWYNEMNSQ